MALVGDGRGTWHGAGNQRVRVAGDGMSKTASKQPELELLLGRRRAPLPLQRLQSRPSTGHVDVIRSLLFRGAHMGAADDRGWTALHFAAAAGQAVAARALLTAAAGGRGGLLEAQNGKVSFQPLHPTVALPQGLLLSGLPANAVHIAPNITG